jgi:hypothetical protein
LTWIKIAALVHGINADTAAVDIKEIIGYVDFVQISKEAIWTYPVSLIGPL